MEKIYKQIINFIQRYQKDTSMDGIVIGISGGKDSTIVAKLFVDAIGADKVLGVLMPNGHQSDLEDSKDVCKILGIDYQIVNIEKSYNNIIHQIEAVNHPNFAGDCNYKATTEVYNATYYVTKAAKYNIAPRLRMLTLYTIAQSLGYRVAGTGNRSERFIGWCTKWGDMASDVNPIAHLTCTEVIELGDYMKLPHHLVHKIPADGLTDKSDEDNFGFTYSELDHLIKKQDRLIVTRRLDEPYSDVEKKILAINSKVDHKDHVITIENYASS